MSKQLLNEAELLLFGHWEQATHLERSLERIRQKYSALYSQVADEVRKAHPKLDGNVTYITQRWGDGTIGFSRKCWPEGAGDWPPGLWIENLRLEILVDDSAPPPLATIWIPPKACKVLGKDVSFVRERFQTRAREILTPDEFKRHILCDGTDNSVLYIRTISKRELIEGISPDEGHGLVQALAREIDEMTLLLPAIDEAFGS